MKNLVLKVSAVANMSEKDIALQATQLSQKLNMTVFVELPNATAVIVHPDTSLSDATRQADVMLHLWVKEDK